MPSKAAHRRFANQLDDILRRALGEEYDTEEGKTRLAADLEISLPSLYNYLNAQMTLPALMVGRLATVIRQRADLSFALAFFDAVLGDAWEAPIPAAPLPPELDAALADLPRFAQEVGESITEVGKSFGDGEISEREYRKSVKEINEAIQSLRAMKRRLAREAGHGECR